MRRTKIEMLEPFTEEQKQLAAQHFSYVRSIVKRYAKRYPNMLYDDLQSAANYALVCSTRDFDSSRGIYFKTFMAYRVNGALKDILSQYYHQPTHLQSEDITIFDRDDSVGWEFNSLDSVYAMLGGLSNKEKRIIELIFVYGKTQAEIAQSLKCSQAEVNRSYKNALSHLSYKFSLNEPRSKRKRKNHACSQA